MYKNNSASNTWYGPVSDLDQETSGNQYIYGHFCAWCEDTTEKGFGIIWDHTSGGFNNTKFLMRDSGTNDPMGAWANTFGGNDWAEPLGGNYTALGELWFGACNETADGAEEEYLIKMNPLTTSLGAEESATSEESKGIITNDSTETPFYHNGTTVAFECGSMSADTSCEAYFWVNATGDVDSNHTFFGTANTDLPGLSSVDSPSYNITIISSVSPTTVSFSLTVPTGNWTNSTDYPGNPSPELDFNATNGTHKYVDPCAQGFGCQASGTPIYEFTNTGNVNLSWKINMNSTLPATMTLMFSTDNSRGGDDLINTSNVSISSTIIPGGTQDLWLWLNLTDALYTDSCDRKIYNLAES